MIPTKKNGFIHNDTSQHGNSNCSPIYGYRDLSVTTLEDAVKSVTLYVPGVEAYADQAKERCKKNTELTLHESAAIYLYTMQTPFHCKLNNTLRAENRDELKPWFAFLKLFLSALGKLPYLSTTVWRGVANSINFNFVDNNVQTWWSVNSCSKDLKVIQMYLDGMGTVFAIETIYGKDIARYSAYPDEQEVILMPGTRVHLKCDRLEIKDHPFIISLKEW